MRQKMVAALGLLIAVVVGVRWHYPWAPQPSGSAPPFVFGQGSYVDTQLTPDTAWQVTKTAEHRFEASETKADGRLYEYRAWGRRLWRYGGDSTALRGRLVEADLVLGGTLHHGLQLDSEAGQYGWRLLVPLAAGLWGLALLVSKRKNKGGTAKATTS